jgi:uncharacterized protein with HEPN domain
MQRDPAAYLWDAQRAAKAIASFAHDKSLEDVARDLLLRSAIERQLEIIGEALSQLAKNYPEVAAKVPDLRPIIAFRNILVHGYAAIRLETVWLVVQEKLPDLQSTLAAILAAEGFAGAAPDERD